MKTQGQREAAMARQIAQEQLKPWAYRAGPSFWESHSCSRCRDGQKPERCCEKSGCSWPRARND